MDQKLLDSFFNELNASLEKPDNFKQTDVKNPNAPVNFSVAQVGDFGVSEIQSTPSDALHSFTLLHSPPQTNELEEIVSSLVSDINVDLEDLMPMSQRVWHYSAQPLLLLSEMKASKPQKTLHPTIDLATGCFTGLEEVDITEDHGSATDSTSLMREPSPLEDFARGSSDFYPFKPGGVSSKVSDGFIEERHVTLSKEDYETDFVEEKLLKFLPSSDRGVAFKGEIPFLQNKGEEKKETKAATGSLASFKDLFSDADQSRQFFNSVYNERAKEFQSRVLKKEEIKNKVINMEKMEGSSDSSEYEYIEEIEYIEGSGSGSDEEVIIITEEYVEEDEEKPVEKEEIVILGDKNSWLDTHKTSTPKNEGYKWAVQENRDMSDFHELVPEMAIEYPFEMDFFQKEAVYHIEQGESVFVAAHTSAGKTVVAEYAIALSLRHMTRVVYTSPIKALSNQKFRDFKDVFDNVGLITGDVSVKPEAACLVLTTEILRSMLYKGADLIRDLEWVIFDEVHYINDPDRGVVWEEVIIMLPDHVGLIFLSATVPNTFEFADWVGRTKKKKVFIVSTNKRPVPLEHYLYANEDIFKIVDKTSTFLHAGYTAASKSFKPAKPGKVVGKPQQQQNRNVPTSNRGSYIKLCQTLKEKNLLPAVVFVFSKKRCSEFAEALSSSEFNTRSESGEVFAFIQKSLLRLKGDDKQLPQVLSIVELLKRGIGVHHGGLLPIIKEMVEILFSRGLIKVLFATETFAMGVNMPARTVVFNETTKYCGNLKRTRDLFPGEYTQMSGRAGRRGIDSVGVVLICAWHEVAEPSSLQTMLTGKALKLASQFRLTYNMILNLLRMSGEFRVEDMMKRSFSESSTSRLAEEKKRDLKKGQKLIKDMEDIVCQINPQSNPPPILAYYKNTKDADFYKKAMYKFIHESNYAKEFINNGRVVIINNATISNKPGVILRPFKATGLSFFQTTTEQSYQVLILNDMASSNVREQYKIVKVDTNDIATFCKAHLKVNDELIVDKFNEKHTQEVVNNLEKLFISHLPNLPPELDPVQDMKIKDYAFNELYTRYHRAVKEINESPCKTCPHNTEQYAKVDKQQKLIENVESIEYFLSEDSLLLKPEFEARVLVLKKLNFINEERIIQLKGKVARELSTCDELIGTELIFENILTSMEPAEIAGLISSLVFQEKVDSPVKVSSPNLQWAQEKLVEIGETLAKVQIDSGLQLDPQDYVSEHINLGLTEIVYAWAKGVAFSEICAMTTVQEGSIVRTIVRLDETIRDFKSAAKIIGEYSLANKMDQASALIKRDIVFASSLYVS